MERKILKFIKDNNMFCRGDKVLVGVSGGADSICLLFVLKNLQKYLNISLLALHVHHGLRGEEADTDAKFVEEICKKWDIQCFTKYVDVKAAAAKNHKSTEEAARILRYEAFEEMADLHNCDKIAVAHHSDDQAETILFQIFRGSGLKGLAGMEPVRGNIVRPLLCVTRMDIEQYLSGKSINYCIDSTNFSLDYSRNKLRNQLIPYIKENINVQAVSHLCNLAEDTRLANQYIEKKAMEICKENMFVSQDESYNNIVRLNVGVFAEDKIIVDCVLRMCINKVTDTLKDITRQHIDNIYQLSLCEGTKEISLPYDLRVTKCYDEMIFGRKVDSKYIEACKNTNYGNNIKDFVAEKDFEITINKEDIAASKNGKSFAVNGQKINFKAYDRKNIEIIEKKAYTKFLDYDKIEDTFALRFRRMGDFLVINEAGGRKKLKDYFIDMKIPRNLRDKQILIADGSHIVWVIGWRISEDVKITEETVRVLEIGVTRI